MRPSPSPPLHDKKSEKLNYLPRVPQCYNMGIKSRKFTVLRRDGARSRWYGHRSEHHCSISPPSLAYRIEISVLESALDFSSTLKTKQKYSWLVMISCYKIKIWCTKLLRNNLTCNSKGLINNIQESLKSKANRTKFKDN